MFMQSLIRLSRACYELVSLLVSAVVTTVFIYKKLSHPTVFDVFDQLTYNSSITMKQSHVIVMEV